MEQQQKILTFWDHLEELRHVLFPYCSGCGISNVGSILV